MRSVTLVLAGLICLSSVSALAAQEEKPSFVSRVLSSLFGSKPAPAKPAPARPAVVVASQPKVESIDEQSTHEQTTLIKCVDDQNQSLQLNSFCLSAADELLAGCGNGPGEIRVYNAAGDFLRSWEIPVKPEAVSTTAAGLVLVGGDGRVFQYSGSGELVREAEAPHVNGLQTNHEELRKQIEQQMKQQASLYEQQVELYEKQIERIKAKGPDQLTARELKQIESLERIRTQMAKMRDRQTGQKLTDEQIEQQVKAMGARKMRIASISSDGDSIFIAVPARVGYGFEVWKMDGEFGHGEKIVSGLRGCCGQMDVQACKDGIFVAENSRHRVVSYDADGKQLTTWGKRDRKGVDGFTSCCNPMNVAFGPNGDVYTAESNTGRIKRFSATGELLEYVGDVKLVPGCKNVSIAVSENGERVYMLDITRNHIVLMKRRSAEAADNVAAADNK